MPTGFLYPTEVSGKLDARDATTAKVANTPWMTGNFHATSEGKREIVAPTHGPLSVQWQCGP
jgi:hypothetical protein